MLRIIWLCMFLVCLWTRASAQDLPFEIQVEDLNTAPITPQFEIGLRENHYHLVADEECVYYGSPTVQPELIRCFSDAKVYTRRDGRNTFLIVNRSVPTDSTYIFYATEDNPKVFAPIVSEALALTPVYAEADGRMLMVDSDHRLYVVSVETASLVQLSEDLGASPTDLRVEGHFGDVSLFTVANRLWITDWTANGTKVILDTTLDYNINLPNRVGNEIVLQAADQSLYRFTVGASDEAELFYSPPAVTDSYGADVRAFHSLIGTDTLIFSARQEGAKYAIRRYVFGADSSEILRIGEGGEPLVIGSSTSMDQLRYSQRFVFSQVDGLPEAMLLSDGSDAGTRVIDPQWNTEHSLFTSFVESSEGDIFVAKRHADTNIIVRLPRADEVPDTVNVNGVALGPRIYDIAQTEEAIYFSDPNVSDTLNRLDKATLTINPVAEIRYGLFGRRMLSGERLLVTPNWGEPYHQSLVVYDLNVPEVREPTILINGCVSRRFLDFGEDRFFVCERSGGETDFYRTDGTVEGTEKVYGMFNHTGDATVSSLHGSDTELYLYGEDRLLRYRDDYLDTLPGIVSQPPGQYLGMAAGEPVFVRDSQVVVLPDSKRAFSLGAYGHSQPVIQRERIYWTSVVNDYDGWYYQGQNTDLMELDPAQDFGAVTVHTHEGVNGREALAITAFGDSKLYYNAEAELGTKMNWFRRDLNLLYSLYDKGSYGEGVAGTQVRNGWIYFSALNPDGDRKIVRMQPEGRTQIRADLYADERLIYVSPDDHFVTDRRIIDDRNENVLLVLEDDRRIRDLEYFGEKSYLLQIVESGQVGYFLWSDGRGLSELLREAGPLDEVPVPVGNLVRSGKTVMLELAREGYREFFLYDGEKEALYEIGKVAEGRLPSELGQLSAVAGHTFYYLFPHPVYGLSLHYFTPPGGSLVKGRVFADRNGNQQPDQDEEGIADYRVVAEGSVTYSTFTDSSGYYELSLPAEEQVTVLSDLQGCYASSGGEDLTFETVADTVIVHDIAVVTEGTGVGLGPYLASAPARCGFTVPFWLTVTNEGCQRQGGTVSLELPEEVTYIGADRQPTDTVGRVLTWAYGDLPQGTEYRIRLELKMPNEDFTGREIPILTHTLTTDGEGRAVRDTFLYDDVLRCAIDPNDKRVWPRRAEQSMSNYTQLDEPLTYMIRFQNTGNDTAFTVRLEDKLSDDLDWDTFRPLASSHDYRVSLREGGNLEVLYKNILLVDSLTNEPESHGFFTFEILAREGLDEFTAIENTAGIYFDFNRPVITNTVKSTLVESLDADRDGYLFFEECNDLDSLINPGMPDIAGNGIDENCDGADGTTALQTFSSSILTLAPNPTGNAVWLRLADRGNYRYAVYSMRGRRVTEAGFRTETRIDLSDLAAGVYLLRVTDESGAGLTRRIVRH
ncbi:T9SS type A sorting domain-containing protein [Lewinella sp. IMCC34191]|uniref:DUF7619 domain-containing protein n=1 Tax=Lewinella sp. IMCC34191 TaxID=2259172 RepID=UPI000E255BAE|nr:T9SS type A sorting domain-containing protein [Lewinella sp. IMCC34191]